jgi:hypothetical protein
MNKSDTLMNSFTFLIILSLLLMFLDQNLAARYNDAASPKTGTARRCTSLVACKHRWAVN